MSIYEASMLYQKAGMPTIILAGEEYGTGSYAIGQLGTYLLGVKAVLALSFERIHRSNLIGMGILPFQIINKADFQNLNLSGEESFEANVIKHYRRRKMWELPFILYRGGTSKGPFFYGFSFPKDPQERDKILLSIMGSPSELQIDGIGGGHALTNKVGLVSPSKRDGVDIDYLMCQVHVKEALVETNIDCGNMLAAAGAFAIESGMVKANLTKTTVRIYSETTGAIMEAAIPTPGGKVLYEGNTHIDGVNNTGSAIKLSFINSVGSTTHKLFPTGNRVDDIEGIPISCLDVSMPMVIVLASHLGKTGYESKKELDDDQGLMEKLEIIRRKASVIMGMGNAEGKTTPKICLVAEPKNTQHTIAARYMIAPFNRDTHPSFAITGAICLSAACLIPNTVANMCVCINSNDIGKYVISIEHPSGLIETSVIANNLNKNDESISFPNVSYIRTARPLAKGSVYIPGEPPMAASITLVK